MTLDIHPHEDEKLQLIQSILISRQAHKVIKQVIAEIDAIQTNYQSHNLKSSQLSTEIVKILFHNHQISDIYQSIFQQQSFITNTQHATIKNFFKNDLILQKIKIHDQNRKYNAASAGVEIDSVLQTLQKIISNYPRVAHVFPHEQYWKIQCIEKNNHSEIHEFLNKDQFYNYIYFDLLTKEVKIIWEDFKEKIEKFWDLFVWHTYKNKAVFFDFDKNIGIQDYYKPFQNIRVISNSPYAVVENEAWKKWVVWIQNKEITPIHWCVCDEIIFFEKQNFYIFMTEKNEIFLRELEHQSSWTLALPKKSQFLFINESSPNFHPIFSIHNNILKIQNSHVNNYYYIQKWESEIIALKVSIHPNLDITSLEEISSSPCLAKTIYGTDCVCFFDTTKQSFEMILISNWNEGINIDQNVITLWKNNYLFANKTLYQFDNEKIPVVWSDYMIKKPNWLWKIFRKNASIISFSLWDVDSLLNNNYIKKIPF